MTVGSLVLWLVVSAVSLAGLGYLLRERRRFRPRFLTLVATTLLGILLFAWVYGFGFDDSQCSGHGSVSCMLNSNQGVLGALALVIAVASFWISYVVDADVHRRQVAARRDAAQDVLESAIHEAHHNLIHIALTFRDGLAMHWAQISIDRISEVTQPEYRVYLRKRLVDICELILRNFAEMERARGSFPPDGAVPEPLAIAAKQRAEEAQPGTAIDICATDEVAAFLREVGERRSKTIDPLVAQHVHLILQSMLSGDPAAAKIEHTQLRAVVKKIPVIAEPRGSDLAIQYNYYYAHRSSEAESSIHSIRDRQSVIVCWIKDADFENTEIIEMQQIFFDRARGHRD